MRHDAAPRVLVSGGKEINPKFWFMYRQQSIDNLPSVEAIELIPKDTIFFRFSHAIFVHKQNYNSGL
jgi:hypothetical protein